MATVCPYCRDTINEEEIAECPDCGIPHHLACWYENNGCSIPGCMQAPETEAKASSHPPPSTPVISSPVVLAATGFKFPCPNCGQRLEAERQWAGMRIDCPKCAVNLAIPQPPQINALMTPMVSQPASVAAQTHVSGACPLCGSNRMESAKRLYDTLVCRRCNHTFANLRTFAFLIDGLIMPVIYLIFALMVAMIIGMIAGISQADQGQVMELANMIGIIAEICGPLLFFCKDGFSGYSVGKGMMGLRVMNTADGKPGGFLCSFLRNLVLVIPFVWIVVAFQLGRGQRVGDGWSNSKVIWRKYADRSVFAFK